MKWIIFFIILWQIRTLLKKVFEKVTQAPQPDGTAPGKITWQGKLKDAAEKIKAEMEAEKKRQAEKASPKPPERQKNRPGKKRADATGQPSKRKSPDGSQEKKGAPITARERVSEFVSPEETAPLPDVSCGKEQGIERVNAPQQRRRGRLSDIRRLENLSQAVVWSEILAPPLSMRNEKK